MNDGVTQDTVPTLDELEALFVNNQGLDAIRTRLGRFNPIKTMGMERMEIRHSAILAWLLDPQETHGMGDQFLKGFLAEALRGHENNLEPSALEVIQSEMMDAEIRREWRNIDILVLSPNNGWVFVIENKFDSSLHSGQLKAYFETAEKVFLEDEAYVHVRGILLTLWDDDQKEDQKDDRYSPIQYGAVCNLLGRLATNRTHPLSPEVGTFINHYLEIIEEATGMNAAQQELERLARELYRDHKKVLDFIVDHGKSTDFGIACEMAFEGDRKMLDDFEICGQRIVFHKAVANEVSFLPSGWYDALGANPSAWEGCKSWWLGMPLIVWMQLITRSDGVKGQIRLIGEVGPIADHTLRVQIIKAIKDAGSTNGLSRIRFQKGATDEGKKYSRFFKQNSFPVSDVHDPEEIRKTIEKAIRSFRPEFQAVSTALSGLSLDGLGGRQ